MIRFSLRIPEDLHARIAAAAASDRRSLNAEMLHLIERGLLDIERAKGKRSTPG